MLHYSNPASFWTTGNIKKEFEYTPGENMFHIYVETGNWIPLSVLVFADDEEHARRILLEMTAFWRTCIDLYEKSQGIGSVDSGDIVKLNTIEKAIKYRKFGINNINKNQLYKISWGQNDQL